MVTVAMPWELIELPFRHSTRWYKKYPNGGTAVATDEEIATWHHVQALRLELAAAQDSTRTAAKNGDVKRVSRA